MPDHATNHAQPSGARSRVRSIVGYIAIMTAGTVLLAVWSFHRGAIPDTPSPDSPAASDPNASAGLPSSIRDSTQSPDSPAASDADARYAEMVVGTWSNFYQGARTMTVRPDGTATMVIELTGIKAALFTPRLELDMVWSIEDGCMKRRNTGGTPPKKVEFVNRNYGDRVAEPIVEITNDRMILRDEKVDRKYEWQRVK